MPEHIFGEDCKMLQGYGIPRWDGPGDISIHSSGEIQPLKDWGQVSSTKNCGRCPTVPSIPDCTGRNVSLNRDMLPRIPG